MVVAHDCENVREWQHQAVVVTSFQLCSECKWEGGWSESADLHTDFRGRELSRYCEPGEDWVIEGKLAQMVDRLGMGV